MERYQYEGILPHARSASESSGADPARVVRIDVVRRMADLLNQAIVHRNSDTPEHAAGSLEACLPHLAELEAALAACRAAFREVDDACKPPPGPQPDETVADPDRVPTEEHASFNLPAEGEAGQEAVTEDSHLGNREVIGRSDNDRPIVLGEDPVTVDIKIDDPDALRDAIGRPEPPPEDDPPLGRKGRRR